MVLACSNAASLSSPKETATVKFWVRALSALTAAASWWNGFHSLESRYLLMGSNPSQNEVALKFKAITIARVNKLYNFSNILVKNCYNNAINLDL